MMKHSNKDIILVLITFFQIILIIYGALTYQVLDLYSLVFIFINACLISTNFQCVSHNFIHNEFFNSKFLNINYSIINSIVLGTPQSFYYIHHMNHHRYNNDFKDTETGTTKDDSSLFRFSNDKKPEGLLRYSFLSYFRVDFPDLLKKSISKMGKAIVLLEITGLLIFIIILMVINIKFFFFIYIPILYLGAVFASMENHFEHFGATPGNRKTDSVSCYGEFYNFIWFNNGYHQEHHYSPTTHWTKIKKIKDELPTEGRKVVKHFHFLNI